MRKKAKNNLIGLVAEIRAKGLYLAVHLYENKNPQLVVTNVNPKKNEDTEADCFFVFSFLIPSNGLLLAPTGINKLRIRSFSKIQGINDGLMRRKSPKFTENINELLKKQ